MAPYRKISLAIMLCLAAASAQAESLSLKAALVRAVANNPLLTEGRLGVASSEQSIVSAVGKHYPRTAVGIVPIALERAIGLERLSPLALVAIGGLMVSTFLTLLYVPIFYTIFEEMTQGWQRLWNRQMQPQAAAPRLVEPTVSQPHGQPE